MLNIIEDLHGNIFEVNPNYQVCIEPTDVVMFTDQDHRIMTRDKLSNTGFLLVRSQEKKRRYGYMFFNGSVYIYGLLTLIGYKPENDIRSNDKKRERQ